MAIVASPKPAPAAPWSEAEHPVFSGAFSPEVRRQMMSEDSQAWTAVSAILLTIVILGAILGFIGMLCAI